jgi:hypothetical protein
MRRAEALSLGHLPVAMTNKQTNKQPESKRRIMKRSKQKQAERVANRPPCTKEQKYGFAVTSKASEARGEVTGPRPQISTSEPRAEDEHHVRRAAQMHSVLISA